MPQYEVFPKLYKSGSKAEQEWQIRVDSVGTGATYTVTHGQVDGKLQTTSTKVTEGKNLGKANETTPYDQARAEAQSKWLKQKDKGYSEERGGASLDRSPMLAHSYKDYKHQVQFPAYIQPKLDGVRCVSYKENGEVKMMSRGGKEHKGLNHIREELENLLHDGLVFDGELYIHKDENFQDLISLIKKDQEGSERVQYHIYDVVDPTRDFIHRFEPVAEALYLGKYKTLRAVGAFTVHSDDEVDQIHDEFKAQGYEGAMIRHGGCQYAPGRRSRQLLKVKKFKNEQGDEFNTDTLSYDREFKIVGFKEGKGKSEGTLGSFECVMDDGVTTFSARPKGSDSIRKEYWENRESYLGKMLTVQYFELTDSTPKVPRFPVGIAIRDYE